MTSIDIYTQSWVKQQQASTLPISPEYGLLAQMLRLREWSPPPLSAKIMSATSPVVPKSATPTAPSMVNMAHEPGVYGSNISVTRLLWVKTPDKLPSSRIPCLYFHAQGSCLQDAVPIQG
jgi:hypothetical protein